MLRWGLDGSAKHEVYELMMRLMGDSCGIHVVSSDIDELIGMSDVVGVVRGGEIVVFAPRGSITKEGRP